MLSYPHQAPASSLRVCLAGTRVNCQPTDLWLVSCRYVIRGIRVKLASAHRSFASRSELTGPVLQARDSQVRLRCMSVGAGIVGRVLGDPMVSYRPGMDNGPRQA